jgi:hypothetical protein
MSEDAQPIQDDLSESERDRALSFHWNPIDFGIFDRLGLPAPRNRERARARGSILTEAYIIGRAEPHRRISYSRRRDFYADQQRYRGTAYTYDTVVAEIDQLGDCGLLENVVAKPGSRGWQSTFRATPELVYAFDRPVPAVYDPHELIRLRNVEGRLIEYRDTAETERMRRELAEINDAIAAAKVALKAPSAVRGENVIWCGNHVLYLAQRGQYRVFNGSFRRGGRLYGPWWQSARSKDRTYIEINDEPTVELDYPELHLRMAYAIAQADPPAEPYTIPGWGRPLVKLAALIMFNATTYLEAIGATANEIGGANARKRSIELIHAVKDKHSAVAQLFHSGLGIKLQRHDADMATCIARRLLRKGVISLSVHDSFLAQTRYGGLLNEEMAAAWWKFRVSVDSTLKSVSYGDSIPQMEGGSASGMPVLVLVLPAPAQLDLFGGPFAPAPSSVPLKDLVGWRSGPVPPSVRRAIDHEIQRRGLRRSDLARRAGISKQQLTNVLHGRFGAGVALASKLRDFIKEGAVSGAELAK